MVCDTILDCPDGDDEAGCENPHIEGILFWYDYFNYVVNVQFDDESLLLLCYECYHSGVWPGFNGGGRGATRCIECINYI